MLRETMITYEMVRDAANAFVATHDRKPTNLEIQKKLGGASNIISGFMKIWRQGVK